jgi:hypothetical protein
MAGVEKSAHPRGLDDTSTTACARGASDACDVGAALAHDRQVDGLEPARERDGQRPFMRTCHPRGEPPG